jgi:hypothetical protein
MGKQLLERIRHRGDAVGANKSRAAGRAGRLDFISHVCGSPSRSAWGGRDCGQNPGVAAFAKNAGQPARSCADNPRRQLPDRHS